MISPLVATQASTPIASIQQNADAQSILHSQNALHETQEQEREVRETVVQKEEAAYYEQSPDAKEEGKNKYQNLYSGKKKKTKKYITKITDEICLKHRKSLNLRYNFDNYFLFF